MARYSHSNWGDLTNVIFCKGIITAVYPEDDTADVTVPGYQNGLSVSLFYHCSDDAEERSNGAIEGAASAFSSGTEEDPEDGDEVIVMCEADTGSPIRIIGFVDGIKECCIFTDVYPYDEEEWEGLWEETSYCHDGWNYVSCEGYLVSSFSFEGEYSFEFVRGGCGGHGHPYNVQYWHQKELDEYIPFHKDTNYFFLVDLEDYLISFSGGGGANATLTFTHFSLLLSKISDGSRASVRMAFGITDENNQVTSSYDSSGSNQTSGIFYLNVLDIIQYSSPESNIEDWEVAGLKILSYAYANASNHNCYYQSNIDFECNSMKVCSIYPSNAEINPNSYVAWGW